MRDRQTSRHGTDRQTHKHTDRDWERQANKHIQADSRERLGKADRQTDGKTDSEKRQNNHFRNGAHLKDYSG